MKSRSKGCKDTGGIQSTFECNRRPVSLLKGQRHQRGGMFIECIAIEIPLGGVLKRPSIIEEFPGNPPREHIEPVERLRLVIRSGTDTSDNFGKANENQTVHQLD
jgi:hypothetical protein